MCSSLQVIVSVFLPARWMTCKLNLNAATLPLPAHSTLSIVFDVSSPWLLVEFGRAGHNLRPHQAQLSSCLGVYFFAGYTRTVAWFLCRSHCGRDYSNHGTDPNKSAIVQAFILGSTITVTLKLYSLKEETSPRRSSSMSPSKRARWPG